MGLKKLGLTADLNALRFLHVLMCSGRSLKGFAPKLQRENLALSLDNEGVCCFKVWQHIQIMKSCDQIMNLELFSGEVFRHRFSILSKFSRTSLFEP